MSSILDALRELEAGRTAGGAAPEGDPRPGARPGLLVAGVLAAVVGAVVAALVVRDALTDVAPPARVATADAPAATAGAPAAPAADAPPPAAAVDVSSALAGAERPRAKVAASRGAPAAGRLASATPYARVRPARRPAADDDEGAPAVRQAARPGEPRVELVELHYADDPAARRVTLGIGGLAPVTLGEGDAAEDVEVSLILPDRAYLRHAGNIFTVRPGR